MSPGEILATSKDHKPPTTPTIKTRSIDQSIHLTILPIPRQQKSTPLAFEFEVIARIKAEEPVRDPAQRAQNLRDTASLPPPKNTATARLF